MITVTNVNRLSDTHSGIFLSPPVKGYPFFTPHYYTTDDSITLIIISINCGMNMNIADNTNPKIITVNNVLSASLVNSGICFNPLFYLYLISISNALFFNDIITHTIPI